MAYFFRLRLLGLFVVGLFSGSCALALVPVVLGPNISAIASYSSQSVADCQASWVSANPGYCAVSNNNGNCAGFTSSSSSCVDVYGWSYSVIPYVLGCPSNSVADGSACACVSGYVENASHTSCEVYIDPNKALCEAAAGQTTYIISGGSASPGATTCAELGCQVTWSDFIFRVTDKTTGAVTSQGDAVITATPCTFDPAAGASQTTCKGKEGVVNGVTVCVAYDPNTNIIESTKKESTTSEATGPAGAASSASSSTSVTSCTGAGSCTTTTTTNTSGSDGSGTTTESKTESLPDFCKENPEALQCKDSQGSFSGTCGAAPSCSGDAVMCAVAAATFATNCALKMPDSSDEVTGYESAKTKTGDQTGELPKSPTSAINVGSGAFDQANVLGASSGMSDLTITVEGQTVTLPFSTINPWLEKLGYLLQAVTFLICAYIVTGNKQGGSA